MKVLIVDDHALIREALHNVLKRLQRETVILEVSNSRQAMRLAEEHPDLDLILLDISLPDRDGFSIVPVGNLRSEILVMQSAQNWHRQRATDILNDTRDRRVLVRR